MTTLTIDIGNHKIKLDYWDDSGFLYHDVYDSIPMEEIRRKVVDLDIKGIIVSSVRKDYKSIINELKEKSRCGVIIDFNGEEIEKYSNKIRYNGKIGSDRIAAYLGAEVQKEGPKLIIDAGTAITLDVVNKEGDFCGGNISLGLTSRTKALFKATSKLPEVEDIKNISDFGTDTFSAIENGAWNGVMGEILYTIGLAHTKYDIEWVFITGGDSQRFLKTLWMEWKNCVPDPHLVGRGLNYHLRKTYFPDEFSHTKFQ